MGGQTTKATVGRSSSQSGGLDEPFMCHEILKENNTSTTFQNHSEVSTRNQFPPPFIINSPHLEYSLDDRRLCFSTARSPNRHGISIFIQFDRRCFLFVYGS
jgi:hypothetical protein